MNKKQLQESIIAGVRKAFSNNKTLNEGFSAWKEENAPKFNTQLFQQKGVRFFRIMQNLVKTKQINIANLSIFSKKENTYKTIMYVNSDNLGGNDMELSQKFEDILKTLSSAYSTPEQLMSIMKTGRFRLEVVNGSYLEKYINATSDGVNNIKNLPYVKIQKGYKLELFIDVDDFLDHADEINEYFA